MTTGKPILRPMHHSRGCTPVDVPSFTALRDHDLEVRCLEVVRLHLPEIAPYAAGWSIEIFALCHHHPLNRYPALAVYDGDERSLDDLRERIEHWIAQKTLEAVIAMSARVSAPSWAEVNETNRLTEAEFDATMQSGMVDVTAAADPVVDIWPYVTRVAAEVGLPVSVLEEQRVELVYRSGDGSHDHVLLSSGRKNMFVVIVVDRPRAAVVGHHLLDLNREYGLE